MSGVFGGGGQGTVRYAVLFDSTQAEQNVKRLQTSFQQLATGSTGLSGKMAIMNNTFTAGVAPIKNTGNALNQLSTTQKTIGSQLAGLGSAFKNNALAIGAAASSVLGLYQNYANLSSAQNAANKSATAAKAAQNSLTTAQNNLNKAVEKYGSGSKEAKQAQDKLTVAQERAINKTETAKIAQDNLNQTMADFGINILPNIVLAGGSIVSIFDNIGGKATGLTGAFTKMKGSLGSLSSSLGTSKLGFLGMAGAIGATTIAAADLFDLLQKGAEVKALNDIITAGKATTTQLEQQIKNIQEMKKRWDIQIFDFFKSGPIGKATLGDTFNKVGDEVIKSLESQVSRIEAAKPLEKLFTIITNGAIPPSAKTGIQTQIKHILAILDNPTNWQNPEFTKTSQAIVQDLITKLGSSISSVDATAGLTGALRQMFVKTFKGVEFGDSPMTKLFAVDPKPIAASLDPIGALYKNTMNKITSTSTTGTRQLVEDSKFVAKMDELAWGAPASSRFANLKAVGSAAYNEIQAKATEAAAKAKAAWDAAQAAFKQGLTAAQTNIKGVFKIESNADKILKDLIKSLPNKAEKEIKLNVRFGQSVDDAKKAFNDMLFEATQVSDSTADASAKSIIDMIDKKFKGVKGPFAGLRAALEAAIADPNTPEKLKQLLMSFNWDSIGVKINKDIQTGINGTPLTVEIKASLAGFLQGGKSRFSGTDAGNRILESLGIKPEDLKITIPPPVVPAPVTTAFDTGVKTLTTSVANIAKTVPAISVDNKPAIKAVDVIAKRIDSLTKLKPDISLQNKQAIKSVDVVAKRIDSLSKIKPSISLSNTQAIKVVDAVAKRIDSLSKLHPHVTVQVDTSGPGASKLGSKTDTSSKFDTSGLLAGGSSKSDSGTGGGDTIINVHVMDETIMRRITARSGRGRFTMGA